jgi:hypothetical protein
MDCVPAGSTWRVAKRVMWATKRYMFLAQTQVYLAEFKIKSDIFGEHLSIDVPFCTDCNLKCNNKGWQLVCVPLPTLITIEKEPVTKVTGPFTSRCARVVDCLVFWHHMWRSSNFHVCNLVHSSTVMSAVIDEKSLSIFLTIGGNFMSISLCSLYTVQSCSHTVRHCHVLAQFNPHFDIRAPTAVLLHPFIPNFTKVSQLVSFIHLVVIPLMRVGKQFRGLDPRWSMVPLVPQRMPVGLALVYRKQYSVSFIVKWATSCMLLVPKVGPPRSSWSGFASSG